MKVKYFRQSIVGIHFNNNAIGHESRKRKCVIDPKEAWVKIMPL